MNRPACDTTSRAALAIAGAAAALAAGGCGGASGAAQQTVSVKTAEAPAPTARTQTAPAPSNKLLATVSATGQVTLTDSGGQTVTRLRSGWYSIFVTVNAAGADFHLTGTSVDSATKAKIPGVAIWGIHFPKGTYHYMNDHDARATTHVLSVY
ncbi:MAG TPA: hypothetical protein VK691_03225 [Solirubrobacteraceae bacterium]|nr:hypothetical protein [Solirubrobacteraceae bacterium]